MDLRLFSIFRGEASRYKKKTEKTEKIKQKSRQIEAIFFIKLWFSDANVVLFYDI